jgi:DNA-directed RNA polymerase specialized sigma24 family protein
MKRPHNAFRANPRSCYSFRPEAFHPIDLIHIFDLGSARLALPHSCFDDWSSISPSLCNSVRGNSNAPGTPNVTIGHLPMIERLIEGMSMKEALELFLACCNTRGTLFITPSWIEPRKQRLQKVLSDPITETQASALRDVVLKHQKLDDVIGWLEYGAFSLAEYVKIQKATEELALINRVLLGDQTAADAFVERYSPLIFHILRQDFQLFDQDADDIHQLVFQRLWLNNCAALRHWQGNNFVPYFRVVVRNLALDFIETRDRRPPVVPPLPGRDVDMRELIANAMSLLSDRDRRLITLKHVEGYTYDEIGDQLKITANAVGVALFRAEERFRHILYREHPDKFGDLRDV